MNPATRFSRSITFAVLFLLLSADSAKAQNGTSGKDQRERILLSANPTARPSDASPSRNEKSISGIGKPPLPQSATGADLVIGAGAQMNLSSRAVVTVGGNFSRNGTLIAGTPTTIRFTGTARQTLNGAATFDNLMKSGQDTLALANSITVNDSLLVVHGYISSGPNTITFGPNGTLNGKSVGSQVLGPNVVIGPDTTSPVVMITSPSSGSILSAVVTIAANATDITGVTSVEFYLGTTLLAADSTAPYSISWNSFNAPNGPYTLSARAYDAAGNIGTSPGVPVTVSNQSGTSVNIAIHNGWNMLSVPFVQSDYRKTTLFPSATTVAFAYQSIYVRRDTLVPGIGYWLKFSGDQFVALSGTTIQQETLIVSPGWNIIGSLSQAIPTSSIIPLGTNIRGFFEYANSYRIADTINPGSGYWVAVDAGGKLVMSTGAHIPFRENSVSPMAQLKEMNTLVIEDATGKSQKLYFGDRPDPSFSVDRFMLPPIPMEGAFDARFGTQRMVEILDGTSHSETPVIVSSAAYPISISWETKGVPASLLIDGTEVRMTGIGKIMVTHENASISLSAMNNGRIPGEFALGQNFPNPFNPTTRIQYSLPSDAKVTLQVYDMLGQRVRILVDEFQSAGNKAVSFQAGELSSGVYYYRLEAVGAGKNQTFADMKKMVLLK